MKIPDTKLDKSGYIQTIPEWVTDEIISKTVFPGIIDSGENADAIMCLGCPSANKVRVPHAAELYKQGRAPRLILSGGVYTDGKCEAERMKECAIELGVPESVILTDKLSYTTIDNMLGAMLALSRDMSLKKVKSIILVTAEFHMARSLMYAKKFLPDFIKIIPSPAKGYVDITNWIGSEYESTVRGEFRGMYYTSDIPGGMGWWTLPEFLRG